VIVDPADLPTDFAQAAASNKVVARNLDVMSEWSKRDAYSDKSIQFHFYCAPVSMDLERGVLSVMKMKLDDNGKLISTGDVKDIESQMVIRSIGYRGEGLPGVPFDQESNVIPSVDSAVVGLENSYVAGWIKRGPSGIIGTNKKDAVACINELISSRSESKATSAEMIDQVLAGRGVNVVDFSGWKRIDAREKELGQSRGRERTTIHDREDLIQIGLGI
jgi:ferredoxin--NADP+ reductase